MHRATFRGAKTMEEIQETRGNTACVEATWKALSGDGHGRAPAPPSPPYKTLVPYDRDKFRGASTDIPSPIDARSDLHFLPAAATAGKRLPVNAACNNMRQSSDTSSRLGADTDDVFVLTVLFDRWNPFVTDASIADGDQQASATETSADPSVISPASRRHDAGNFPLTEWPFFVERMATSAADKTILHAATTAADDDFSPTVTAAIFPVLAPTAPPRVGAAAGAIPLSPDVSDCEMPFLLTANAACQPSGDVSSIHPMAFAVMHPRCVATTPPYFGVGYARASVLDDYVTRRGSPYVFALGVPFDRDKVVPRQRIPVVSVIRSLFCDPTRFSTSPIVGQCSE